MEQYLYDMDCYLDESINPEYLVGFDGQKSSALQHNELYSQPANHLNTEAAAQMLNGVSLVRPDTLIFASKTSPLSVSISPPAHVSPPSRINAAPGLLQEINLELELNEKRHIELMQKRTDLLQQSSAQQPERPPLQPVDYYSCQDIVVLDDGLHFAVDGRKISRSQETLHPFAQIHGETIPLDESHGSLFNLTPTEPVEPPCSQIDGHIGVCVGQTSLIGPSNYVDNTIEGLLNTGDSTLLGRQDFSQSPALINDLTTFIPEGPMYNTIISSVQPAPARQTLKRGSSEAEHNATTPSRKRLQMSGPCQDARLSIIRKQLSKKTGVPELSLDALCFAPKFPIKRSRTSEQRRNRRAVEQAGGSCILCAMKRKKCSGQRPCDQCRDWWGKRAYDSSSFQWTCDYMTKLTDYLEFDSTLELDSTMAHHKLLFSALEKATILPYFGIVQNSLWNIKSTSTNTHKLNERDRYLLDTMRVLYNITKWKKLPLRLCPELRQAVELYEGISKSIAFCVLSSCETLHKSVFNRVNILRLSYLLDFVGTMRKVPMISFSSIDHLLLAIEARLKILCVQVLTSNSTEKPKDKLENLKTAAFVQASGASSCLPPNYGGSLRDTFVAAEHEQKFTLENDEIYATEQSCLRLRKSGRCVDRSDLKFCRCGWLYDCVEPNYPYLFGFSAKSFMRAIHGEEESSKHMRLMEMIFGKVSSTMQIRQDMKKAFQRLLGTYVKWTFKYTARYWENNACSELQTKSFEEAEKCRQSMLLAIIEAASLVWSEFWKYRIGCESTGAAVDDIEFDFRFWMCEDESFIKGSLALLASKLIEFI